MSNVVWLFDYSNCSVADIYGIVVKTAKFDGAEDFKLRRKKRGDTTLTSEEENALALLDKAEAEFWQAWKNYEHIPQESMPIKLFKKPDRDCNNLPEPDKLFFRITNAYLVLHKKLYDVISQFNLGKTHFSEVHIYDIETEEKLSDTPYYFRG